MYHPHELSLDRVAQIQEEGAAEMVEGAAEMVV
jgi:hypothetical protein